jgi:phenylpropionate dioxygenase-like ring-hydroxylating dioxygenase large terminal subunit
VELHWPAPDNRVIPRQIMVDPELFRLEMTRVFGGPTWHLVGANAEIPNPGDWKRATVGPVQLIVVRTTSGRVNTFINSCAHRGAELLAGACGNVKTGIRCIYHLWTYDLEGSLIGVALPEEFPEEFRKSAHGLTSIRTEVRSGCIFVTLSPGTPPLLEYLGERAAARLADVVGEGELVYLGSQSATFRCNWKLCSENQFDSYHVPVLHRGLMQILKGRASPGSTFDVLMSTGDQYAHAWHRFESHPVREQDRDVLNDYSIIEVKGSPGIPSNVLCTFPGDVMCNQLDVIQLRYVTPIAPDRTIVEFANFGKSSDTPELREHRLRQAHLLGPSGVITIEDGCALEKVQMSCAAGGENFVLKGALVNRPPYGYGEEGGIRQFYATYRRLMGF